MKKILLIIALLNFSSVFADVCYYGDYNAESASNSCAEKCGAQEDLMCTFTPNNKYSCCCGNDCQY